MSHRRRGETLLRVSPLSVQCVYNSYPLARYCWFFLCVYSWRSDVRWKGHSGHWYCVSQCWDALLLCLHCCCKASVVCLKRVCKSVVMGLWTRNVYDIIYGIIIALHVAFRALKCCNSVVDWHWTSIICIKCIEFVLICFMVYYVSYFCICVHMQGWCSFSWKTTPPSS